MVTWNWKKVLGWATTPDNHTVFFYEGNCYLVILEEYEKTGEYSFYTFFNDLVHAKRMLGLTKEFKDVRLALKNIYINTARRNGVKLAEIFTKAYGSVSTFYDLSESESWELYYKMTTPF